MRSGGVVLGWINEFMSSFLFPPSRFLNCGSGRGEEPGRGKSPPPDSDPFSDVECEKNPARLSRQTRERLIKRIKSGAESPHSKAGFAREILNSNLRPED